MGAVEHRDIEAFDPLGIIFQPQLGLQFAQRSLAALFPVMSFGEALPCVLFGQRSRLDFTQVETNPALGPERFRFTPPAGADVIQQP